MTRKDRIDDLIFLLDGLERLHDDLASVVREKLAHMRTGSIEGMQACTQREHVLVARIAEQEGLRKQLMEAIGKRYGAAPQRARGWTASELAERLDEPQRGRLTTAAKGLKQRVAELARLNRKAGLISHEVLRHFRHVFAAIAGIGTATAAYSPRGNVVAAPTRGLFDTVA